MAKPGPKPRIKSADVLGVFDRRDDRAEPLTAPELAESLNCSRRTALDRLTDLAEGDRLRSKQVGGRSRVYWTPIASGGVSEPSEASPAGGADTAPETDSEGIDSAGPHVRAEAIAAPDDLEAAIDATGLDAERRDAVRAMYALLSEQGTARKSDFTSEVYPDHPAGYGSPGGWWNKLGKESLASLPGVSKPAEGRPTWQFSGE